jgi:S1-C subfamily serine protease
MLVALALRADAPIRVTRRLLDEAPEIEIAPRDSVPEIARALGLTVVLPTPELQEAFGLPRRDGVVVVQISARGAGLGLQRGDLIIEVNGMVPKTPLAFFEAMRGGGRATSALVKYWRGGAEREVRIPLPAQAPDEDTRTRVEVD